MNHPGSSTTLPEEHFDVVDQSDNVLYALARSEVHKQKLLHRAVHVFLFHPDGRLLIHKRSSSKEEFPSVWTSSCSGHVSAGDSYDQTAPRELHEELGIQNVPLTRLHKFPASADTSWEFTVLYSTISNQTPHPDPSEITAIKWLFPDEIATWMSDNPRDFSPAYCLLFNWYRQKHST
jgi:isopentenyl-diphosphate delta-isomerase